MAECLNYNCEELGEHEVLTLQCKGPRPAGISEVVFILCGNNLTNPSSGAEVLALLASNEARKVQRIRMGLNSSEPTQSPKTTSCGLPETLFVTYSGSLTDYSFNATNMDFWNDFAGGYTVQGAIARMCPKAGFDDESLYMDGEISFTGSPIVPDDDEEAARFELTYQFKGTVTLVPTPPGVFS